MKILNYLTKIINYIIIIPILIVMFPFIIILTLIDSKRYNIKKRFRFLRNYGFIIKKDKVFSKVYYFIKNQIIIKIIQDVEYKISYDNGNNYVNIFDTKIGTIEERTKLKDVIIEYHNSHPVDKQRGDAIDTAQFYISFLKKYIDQVEQK